MVSAVLSVGLLMTLSCLLSPVSSHDTVCTYIYNQTCIDAVKAVLVDKDLFWFGSDYATHCPQGPTGAPACHNIRSSKNDSLMTRILEEDSATSDSIQFVVNVTYTLAANRSYMGCGEMVNVTSDQVKYKKIDPISGHTVKPFDVSTMPSVTWPAQNDVNYSVIYVDVGNLILHGVYVNIPGGDVTLGQVVKEHHGPRNPRELVNAYSWLVFQQQDELTVQDVQDFINNNKTQFGGISMSALIQKFNMTGPVGINTVRSVTDEYAVTFMRRNAGLNYCPRYTQHRIVKMAEDHGGLTFNLSHPGVSMSIDLKFQHVASHFCCDANKLQAVDKSIDFTKPPMLHGEDTRGHPKVMLVGQATFGGPPPAVEYFTLIAVDLSMEFNKSMPHSVVHWLIVNIQGHNVISGDTVLEYHMLNPGNSNRSFLFLLYKQTTGSSETIKNITGLSGPNCPTPLTNRCKFHIAQYVSSNNLVLTGVRVVKVMPDQYSRYRHDFDTNKNMNEACKDTRGNGQPCATGGVTALGQNVGTVLCILCTFLAHIWRQ